VAESVELATILLTDLVGSTRPATSVGPVRADELREEHFELLREAIAAYGGRIAPPREPRSAAVTSRGSTWDRTCPRRGDEKRRSGIVSPLPERHDVLGLYEQQRPRGLDFPSSDASVGGASAVAVGTALRLAGLGSPPRRSQRARLTHWAPGLGSGVKAHARPGMHDAVGG
jgi:class 3 adenylate cyclase